MIPRLAVVVTGVILSVSAMAQGSAPPKKAWTTPRTPDGKPDLQGIFSTATLTPLERPADPR